MVSMFDRAGSLARGVRRKPSSKRARRDQDRRLRLAIDQLEQRLALAITTPLSIGGATVGSFLDAPTGPGNVSDFVTVSIEGTRGTVVFNGGAGVADGTNIQTIDIFDASPDFQLTFSATVGTANAVPYGSDGIIQMGRITTSNVIRGINTVRGPLTNTAPTTGVASPIGFTQTAPGSNTLTLEGNQTGTFAVGAYVCATPLLSSTTVGAPSFGTVTVTSFDVNTNLTTLTFDNTTATGTTAGALTLATRVQPYFTLTTFTGVNFSNRNLRDGGGIFVDRVVGADTEIDGVIVPDLGILLTQGLLAYSSIGIRDVLDAGVILGTSANAAVDGRVFIESATGAGGSYMLVGRRGGTSQNSKFELLGGDGEFGADVTFFQNFNGVVNLGGIATGAFDFLRSVGSLAVLNADRWDDVEVTGDFAGTINATSGPDRGDISLSVAGNLAATARINAADDLSLSVGRSVLKGATIAAGSDISLDIGGNFAGAMTGGGDLSGAIGGNVNGGQIVATTDLSLDIGGSIVNSAISTDNDHTLAVAGSIRNSRFFAASGDMSIDVEGSVTNSSFNVGYDSDLELVVGGSLSGSNLQSGSGDVSVDVTGNVTRSLFTSTSSNVTIGVGGDFLRNRIVTGDEVSLSVGRDALNNTVIADDDVTLDIGRNWSGVAQSASSDVVLSVGGSVLKGSSFASGEDTAVNVARNFDGTTTSRNLRFFVGGNVSKASRIVAQAVNNWQAAGTANFGIGGRLDGIVNVGVFDAATNNTTVTILGNGAGQGARFYVDRFETDTLVFNGNFRGNLRVLQDLVANLEFNGNVDRITIGGRVGSYVPGNTITTTPASIAVTGRLLYLNSNSFFQAITPGQSGIFWNDAISPSPSLLTVTGSLVTGSYVKVVPTRQTQPAPGPTPAQQYAVPGVPTSFAAGLTGDPDNPPFTPYGIDVSFAAPTSSGSLPGDGNLPVLYYEYSTNANLGAGATWRRFASAAQGPGTNIALPAPSTGGTFTQGVQVTYFVSVRAVNALGAGAGTGASQVIVPATTP